MKNKRNIRLACAFVLVCLAGVACMRVWDCFRMPEPVVAEVPGSSSLLLVNLADPTGPADLPGEDEPPQDYKDASAVPSHLPNIKMQGVEKITFLPSATQQEEEEPAPKTPKTPVHLGSADHIVPNATMPRQLPEEESKISMISVPVQVRVIKTADDYKAFKRVARGKYPQANFAKDNIITLESTGNWPDKVFEIQDVVEQNGKMVVLYRVNIFGMDKKTNTHSVVRVAKRNLPVELKQVL